MTRGVINPPELPAVNPTYSQAIRANGFVYVAGQISVSCKMFLANVWPILKSKESGFCMGLMD